jgi:hypothetical protein
VPLILSKRAAAVTERMDAPDCDDELLHNTYVQFRTINILLSGWRLIYLLHLKPRMTDTSGDCTLLDIGFGGGDIPYYLARWAEKDGINLHVTGIEKDPRACAFAKGYYRHRNVRYRCATLSDIAAEGLYFDFVISNNMVHHLSESELQLMMAYTAKSARAMPCSTISRGVISPMAPMPSSPGCYTTNPTSAMTANSPSSGVTPKKNSAPSFPKAGLSSGYSRTGCFSSMSPEKRS